MKRILALGLIAAMLTGCTASSAGTPNSNDGTIKIALNRDSVTVNGESAGTDTGAAVYTGNDIVYYEDRDTYDSGNVYGEGSASDRHTAEEAAPTLSYISLNRAHKGCPVHCTGRSELILAKMPQKIRKRSQR